MFYEAWHVKELANALNSPFHGAVQCPTFNPGLLTSTLLKEPSLKKKLSKRVIDEACHEACHGRRAGALNTPIIVQQLTWAAQLACWPRRGDFESDEESQQPLTNPSEEERGRQSEDVPPRVRSFLLVKKPRKLKAVMCNIMRQ